MTSSLSTTDCHILNAIRTGDHEVFRAFYTEYLDLLLRFAYSYTRSVPSAQDAVADVFVAIWERRSTWSPTSSLRAYLLAAVRNRALDNLRHRQVTNRAVEGPCSRDLARATTAVAPAMPDENLEQNEQRERLRNAIANLSPDRRRALMLRWQEGLSPVEIADVMGIPRASVDQLISRSIKQLRAIFEE